MGRPTAVTSGSSLCSGVAPQVPQSPHVVWAGNHPLPPFLPPFHHGLFASTPSSGSRLGCRAWRGAELLGTGHQPLSPPAPSPRAAAWGPGALLALAFVTLACRETLWLGKSLCEMQGIQVGDPRRCCLIPTSLPPSPGTLMVREEGLSPVVGVGGIGTCKTYGMDPTPAAKRCRGRWQVCRLAEAFGTPLGAELSLPPPKIVQGFQISHC